jgi:twitching motility protein PilT
MLQEMPLDIQWLTYALVSNNALTVDDARQLAESLPEPEITAFAQAVLDRLAAGMEESDVQVLLEQIQELVNYAVEQAATGEAPPEVEGGGEGATGEDGIASSDMISFAGMDIDISGVNSYEDLPSLSDASELSDEELAQRVVYLLACLRKLGCSDLHLSGGAPPFVRRKLEVERLDSYVLTEEDSFRVNTVLLPEERKQEFIDEQDLSFAVEVGCDRFRVALMQQKEGTSGSYRLVPDHICSLEELGFIDDDIVFIRRMLDYTNGLVLVTGPIGAGKTTTLAAMIDIVNEKRCDHIISIEDPIEILQTSKNCQVTQREVGHHTASYSRALKAALREDPDVIVIGEMHDLDTIENAITASETGHLVIGTLHTGDAANTMNRVLDVFPPAQQPQIRAMTAGSLRGVVCQKLIRNGMGGLEVVYEILINTMAVANTINEGKTFRLKSTMVTSNKQGMCTMDQCILRKYEMGKLTYDAALCQMSDLSIKAQLNAAWAAREAAASKKGKK